MSVTTTLVCASKALCVCVSRTLDEILMSRAIHVSIVAGFCLVLYMSRLDGDTTRLLFRGLVDIFVLHDVGVSLLLVENLSDRSGQRGLAVINVTVIVSSVVSDSSSAVGFERSYPMVPMFMWGLLKLMGDDEIIRNPIMRIGIFANRSIVYQWSGSQQKLRCLGLKTPRGSEVRNKNSRLHIKDEQRHL